MRRFILFASALVLPLLAGACSQTQQQVPSGPPRMTIVGGDTINWGKVQPGMLTRRLVIENSGGDTLEIANVAPSCGCTTAPLSKSKLGPGDTASVDVSIDMKDRRGPQHKTITITSNDSTRQSTIVTLMADVQMDMAVEPSFFPVGTDVKVNQEYETAVEVKNFSDKPLTLQPPSVLSQETMKVRFDLTQPTQIQPGSSQRIVAHVTPLSAGTLQTNVVLKTSSPTSPELQLPLYTTAQ